MRRAPLAAVLVIVLAFAVVGLYRRGRTPRHTTDHFQRGVALGLFASDSRWDYGGMIDEIAELGATDVELDVMWEQGPLGSTTLAPRDGLSPSLPTLRRTIAQARRAGLRIFLFPIVHVAATAPGDWRGRISFDSDRQRDAWWASYGAFVGAMAALAEEAHVERLSIGSELVRLEPDRARWVALIADVRRRYHGRILYSANWDHFASVPFWDLLDEVGVTGYFELTRASTPEGDELRAGWRTRLTALAAFAAEHKRPLVLTEVGYPSQRGAHARPWDDQRQDAIDLEEQRLCYDAFLSTAAESPFVDGIYVWNWFGVGGPNDVGYTPRGKPAAEVLRAWLRGVRRSWIADAGGGPR